MSNTFGGEFCGTVARKVCLVNPDLRSVLDAVAEEWARHFASIASVAAATVCLVWRRDSTGGARFIQR